MVHPSLLIDCVPVVFYLIIQCDVLGCVYSAPERAFIVGDFPNIVIPGALAVPKVLNLAIFFHDQGSLFSAAARFPYPFHLLQPGADLDRHAVAKAFAKFHFCIRVNLLPADPDNRRFNIL
jgi:hypothetical protein